MREEVRHTSPYDYWPSPWARPKLMPKKRVKSSLTRRLKELIHDEVSRASAEEKARDWLDLETPEDLNFRLNMFNLGSNDADDQIHFQQPESSRLENAEFVQNLKKIYVDKMNQIRELRNKPEPSVETLVKNQIQLALDYYKDEMNGGDYEFVKCEKMVPPSLLVTHINFYARLKDVDSSPELFFAVLKNGSPQYASHCCKLDLSEGRSLSLNPFEVLHCEHVKCTSCAEWSDVVIVPGDGVYV